jgi:hypothetical protein
MSYGYPLGGCPTYLTTTFVTLCFDHGHCLRSVIANDLWSNAPHPVFCPLTPLLLFHFYMVFCMTPSVPLMLAFLFTNPVDSADPLSEIGLGVQLYQLCRLSTAPGIWIEWRDRGQVFRLAFCTEWMGLGIQCGFVTSLLLHIINRSKKKRQIYLFFGFFSFSLTQHLLCSGRRRITCFT